MTKNLKDDGKTMQNLNLDFNFKSSEDIENKIGKFICTNDCEQMYIDLSTYNLFDAIKIATICSTKHFLKYRKGKIFLNLKDETTKNIISPLKLRNMVLKINNGYERMVRA